MNLGIGLMAVAAGYWYWAGCLPSSPPATGCTPAGGDRRAGQSVNDGLHDYAPLSIRSKRSTRTVCS
ncbi:hypothetical protein BamMEX5DRAFT_6929 [Burkholderia ambifaria MEX-5]|uniref:Uncharacterized protein n=1 Tax=Burkholderia ambifaria MEX-5 TaxID=396597 RepID=B1TGL3_9BURK|nr:hypothetical protein BamMEX5DRAFT_6929 [Burkholderia ambifaria MEX-5]